MDKTLTTLISAALVGAGLWGMGLAVKGGLDNLAFRDRQVSVRGLAERTVQADYVTWPISYSVAGNNLMSLYDQVTANNRKIRDFLTSNGIDPADISIAPPDTYNATTNRYASGNFQYDYSLTCTVTVGTANVAKVRELLDRQSELLREGVPYSNSYINWEYRGLNTIKPQMIADATRAAREAAQQFASDSGSRLGQMKSASQGQFSIEEVASSTPYVKNVRVVSTIVYYLKD